MDFGERVVEARVALGFNQSEFAKEIALAAQSLARYEKNKVKPSVEFITKLTDMFNINSNWLLTGKGEMLLDNNSNLPSIPGTALSEDVVSINYYPDVYAAAGYGAINGNVKSEIMNFDRKFIEQFLNVRRFDLLDIIHITGDSMEPFIQNGETVILERNKEARNGETVIALINGETYVKRYQADPFKKWIRLISDNKLYGDITLSTPEHMQALSIVGIVRAKIKPF